MLSPRPERSSLSFKCHCGATKCRINRNFARNSERFCFLRCSFATSSLFQPGFNGFGHWLISDFHSDAWIELGQPSVPISVSGGAIINYSDWGKHGLMGEWWKFLMRQFVAAFLFFLLFRLGEGGALLYVICENWFNKGCPLFKWHLRILNSVYGRNTEK